MNGRRLVYASVIGAVIAAAPVVTMFVFLKSSSWATAISGSWVEAIARFWATAVAVFAAPGIIIAILFAGGNVHNYAWQIAVLVNFIFYSGLAYALLTVRAKLQAKSRNKAQLTHTSRTAE